MDDNINNNNGVIHSDVKCIEYLNEFLSNPEANPTPGGIEKVNVYSLHPDEIFQNSKQFGEIYTWHGSGGCKVDHDNIIIGYKSKFDFHTKLDNGSPLKSIYFMEEFTLHSVHSREFDDTALCRIYKTKRTHKDQSEGTSNLGDIMNSTGNVLPTPTAEPQVVFRNHGTSELYIPGTDHIADPSLEGNLIQSMTGQDLFGNLLESSNMDFQSTQVDFQATRTEHQLGTEEELQFDFNMDVSELLRSPTTVMCELGTGDTQMGASSGGIQSYPKSASLAPLGNGNQTGNHGDQINKDGTGVQGNGSSHSLETTQQPECLPTNGNGNGHLPLVTNTVDAGAYPNFFQDGGGLSSQMRTHYNLKLKKLKTDIKVRDARIEQLQSGVNWKLSMKDAEIAALKAELAKKG